MSFAIGNPVGKLQLVAGIVLIALASVLSVENLPTLQVAENLTYDLRINYFSELREQSADIVIVGITDETLSSLPYRSPIDRRYLSDLLLELEAKEVRAVGLDILIDQATEPEKDAILKNVLSNFRIPLVVATATKDDGLLSAQVTFQKKFLEGIEQGSAAVIRDNVDGVVRAIPIYGTNDGDAKLSFIPQLAQAIGIDLPPKSLMYIDYKHGPDKTTPLIPIYPAHAIQLLPKEWFVGKVVLVGFELELEDRHSTPMSRGRQGVGRLSGVQIHAQALAQLIEDRVVRKAGFIANFILAAAIAGFGLSLLFVPLGLRNQLAAATSLLLLIWIAGILVFVKSNVMLNLMSASLALIVSSFAAFIFQWRRERGKKEFIHKAFSKYLSPGYVDQLVANPDQLSVKGEHRVITYLFTDLAGFTPLTEALPPSDLVALINEYLDKTCEIATRHGGMVAAIVGDALHVLYNAPVFQEDHAQRAVEAAMELDDFCQQYASAKRSEGIPLGETRIGVNTGMDVLGNFGGNERIEYTAMGDAINTAARLESVNKHLGTRICISESTVMLCHGINFRPIGNLVLKGKTDSVKVYEPLPDNSSVVVDRNDYLNAYKLMEEQDSSALAAFRSLSGSNHDDPLVTYHLERLERGETGTTLVMKEK